jgi:hypothetical protein
MQMMPPADTRDVQGAAVHRTAFFPPDVRRKRKRLWKSLLGARFRIKDLWSPRFTLVHDARVLELLDESFFASVKKGSDLL